MDSRLGIDVGGTFTDFVLLGDAGLTVAKRPSTPADPLQAVREGIAALGVGPDTAIVHGTTVVTNAILQAKGARTAFVTTQGFVDLLAIGRQDRPSLYDLRARPPAPLVPPERCFEVAERIAADGSIVRPLDPYDVERLVEAIAASAPDAIALCFLFSFLRPEHEHAVAARLRQRLPDLFISCSADVAPEFREYERASTTVVDAFAGPLAAGYLRRLRAVAPHVQLMQSSGGLIAPETAAAHPVCLALSGPAGGVAGAVAIARGGADRLITLDMGGTSTDVAFCLGAVPMMTEGRLGGWPLLQPMVAVHTIGAGGGSIAWVDTGGALRVGPASAGADPGPACYGRGTEPTVSDANLLLGRLEPERLLGGAMRLYPDAAAAALQRLGQSLGLDAVATAAGVARVVDAAMTRAMAHVSVEQGHDPRDCTLVAFGGAGPMHACALAESLGMRSVLVPRFPGVLSALGMALADQTRDYRRGILRPAAALDDAGLAALFAPLLAQARAEAPADAQLRRYVDARYAGQSFELTVPADDGIGEAIAAFHDAHQARYGYQRPERPVEFVTLRLRSLVPSTATLPFAEPAQGPTPAPTRRRVWYRDGWQETLVLPRAALPTGERVTGPALITQPDATTVVAPAWSGEVDRRGNLLLHRMEAA